MSLYIGSAISKHAVFKDEDDYEAFDQLKTEISKISDMLGVFITRMGINNDGDEAFVITNKKMKNFDCLYSGAAFEYDLSIKPDDSFDAKANAFIQALEANDKFETFHGLDWSTSAARHYVIS